MERFDGKHALVTGAASGIGRATAERLAVEGARVFCADIDEGRLKDTAEAIRSAGGQVATGKLDVSDAESCRRCVESAIEKWGRLDVLCNVAGIGIYAHATELSQEQWQRVISVNLSGTFFMSQAVLSQLLERLRAPLSGERIDAEDGGACTGEADAGQVILVDRLGDHGGVAR